MPPLYHVRVTSSLVFVRMSDNICSWFLESEHLQPCLLIRASKMYVCLAGMGGGKELCVNFLHDS